MDDNLLILDEPTDGFSKEQMYQLKYVFDGLNASPGNNRVARKRAERFCRVYVQGCEGRRLLHSRESLEQTKLFPRTYSYVESTGLNSSVITIFATFSTNSPRM